MYQKPMLQRYGTFRDVTQFGSTPILTFLDLWGGGGSDSGPSAS